MLTHRFFQIRNNAIGKLSLKLLKNQPYQQKRESLHLYLPNQGNNSRMSYWVYNCDGKSERGAVSAEGFRETEGKMAESRDRT